MVNLSHVSSSLNGKGNLLSHFSENLNKVYNLIDFSDNSRNKSEDLVNLENFSDNSNKYSEVENSSNHADNKSESFSGSVTKSAFLNKSNKSKAEATRLCTIIVCIQDKITGYRKSVRALMDSGAECSFISTKCARDLNLEITDKSSLVLSTFGKTGYRKNYNMVSTRLFGNLETSSGVDCNLVEVDYIIEKISGYGLTRDQTNFISENAIVLADPDAVLDKHLFVDVLLGQDYFHSFMLDGKLIIPGNLVLVPVNNRSYALCGKSLVSLKMSGENTNPVLTTVNFDTLSPAEEQRTLDRFIDIEALGIGPIDKEISPILEDFNKSTYHNNERYVIRLPWKEPQKKKLATNFSQAFFRLLSGQNRYKKPKYAIERQKYEKIMQEQLNLGILEKVQTIGTPDEVIKAIKANPHAFDKLAFFHEEDGVVHYLPHHGVYKASTGSFRIVYDADARPAKGTNSLNDCLETGPNLMNSLVVILLRFRKGRYASKADIQKAFLQIEVAEQDRDALRLLWIEDGQVQILRYTKLPFGLTCSPFILGAVLQKHLNESEMDPEMKDEILASFYVDDNVFAMDNIEDLMNRKETAVKIFAEAGMNLRQWTSNHPEARRKFFEAEGEELPLEETVLGLSWNLESDNISINHKRVTDLIGKEPKTKRQLYSYVAQIYDPLGLVSPYTVVAKFLIRDVAESCKGWDSKLPKGMGERVLRWTDEFSRLSEIQLPRNVSLQGCKKQMLVGFCDASAHAIGACIYLVSSNDEETVSHLVMSKSRIKPAAVDTIPRLELIGAEILCSLMATVRMAYPEIAEENIYYFTDAAVVMYWIYSGSTSQSIFVANRLRKVRGSSDVERWGHVDTTENPADYPSRGCSLADLIGNNMWWNGPKFITKDIHSGKSTLKGYDIAYKLPVPEEVREEVRISMLVSASDSCVKHINVSKIVDINKFSSYQKLMLTTQFILKFVKNTMESIYKLPACKFLQDNVIAIQFASELSWIHATQREHFQDIFDLCNNERACVSPVSKSIFRDHKIFLDNDLGILRCKTRMENSELPYSTVYPILLPSKSHFTNLLIRNAHELTGHRGIPHTLSHIRAEFWILAGRRAVKTVISRCNTCIKVDGRVFKLPDHPPLPEFRVKRARCFKSIGIDFTGHFMVRDAKTGVKSKAYMLIFTCAASRASHLEATQGMSTTDFMLGFTRFLNTRGTPEHIESDNGGAFVRANSQLKSIFSSKRTSKFLNQKRITWNFYTERSPWMGGWIERLNGIFKSVCRKTFGKTVLSFEEFRTMTCFANAVLNERPLTYVYSEINAEETVLTPSMLLNGFNLTEPPHLCMRKTRDREEIKFGARYEVMEKLKDSFWKIWQNRYLVELTEKHSRQCKAQADLKVPKINDVVLIKHEILKRREWKLGKIINLKMGRDQKVRECTVKTHSDKGKYSVIKRSPSFLIPLEVGNECDIQPGVVRANKSRNVKRVRFAL